MPNTLGLAVSFQAGGPGTQQRLCLLPVAGNSGVVVLAYLVTSFLFFLVGCCSFKQQKGGGDIVLGG